MHKTIGKTQLSPLSISSPFTSELCGDRIVVRFLGLIPWKYIFLSDIHYLRLATRDEVSLAYLLLNYSNFFFHRRHGHPVYVIQTKQGRNLFLKLAGGAHFRLRQAIGRQAEQRFSKAA